MIKINASYDAIMKKTIAWFGNFPKGQMDFEEADYRTLLYDARNVIFTEGIAEGKQRMSKALEEVARNAETSAAYLNFWGGRTYLIQITADKNDPLSMEEMEVLQCFTAKMKNDVSIKYVMNCQNTNGKVIIKIAATNLSEKSTNHRGDSNSYNYNNKIKLS